MREAIEQMPRQLREGAAVGAPVGAGMALPAAVVIAGMGGSAMGGELLRGLVMGDSPVPITRVRGYGIPTWAGTQTLVVCVSYSGETAETLSCARQAHRQGASILGVGMGGSLARLLAEWGMPFAQVPGGLPPRAALGYLVGAMAGAFATCGLAPDGIAEECAIGVEGCDRALAERLGGELAGRIPLIYGAGPLAAVAYRWKTQLNENAKIHAFSHAFPEFAHNEIEGWGGADLGNFAAVFLRDAGESAQVARQMDAAVDMVGRDAALVETVNGSGGSVAARAFSLVALGDWVSFHAAAARGVDPMLTARLAELKQRTAGPA
jgi:glucose/mannose-6-phosphate isomerase